MGNCCNKNALKVTVERAGKKSKVHYITNKQLRVIRTFGEFLLRIDIPLSKQKFMYSLNGNSIEIIAPYSQFKIKNFVVNCETEYFIYIEPLYR